MDTTSPETTEDSAQTKVVPLRRRGLVAPSVAAAVADPRIPLRARTAVLSLLDATHAALRSGDQPAVEHLLERIRWIVASTHDRLPADGSGAA